MIDPERVWQRILNHSGHAFHQMRGKPFTYGVSGRTIYLDTTNGHISRTAIEKALQHVRLANTVPVQHLSAPSYIYGILTDQRISTGDW